MTQTMKQSGGLEPCFVVRRRAKNRFGSNLLINYIAMILIPFLYPCTALATDQTACHVDGPIVRSLDLLPSCVYRQSLTVAASVVTLDCHNALIDGQRKEMDGLLVEAAEQIENVEIRNCNVKNFRRMGIWIRSLMSPSEKQRLHPDTEERYLLAPARVLVKDSRIENNGGDGVFVGDQTEDISIEHNHIIGNRGVGLYLEFGTRRIRVVGNVIQGNGRPGGNVAAREGIAVDSSADNTIVGNTIYGNGAGGVFLYRNCDEYGLGRSGAAVHRWQNADRNLIENNKIGGSPIGIWVAQRQSLDQALAKCGRKYYHNGQIVEDFAKHNKISKNEIGEVGRGVIVEDDENTVVGNNIIASSGDCVVVGTQWRSDILHHPVRGTVVAQNACRSLKSGGAGYQFGFSADTTGFGCNALNAAKGCIALGK